LIQGIGVGGEMPVAADYTTSSPRRAAAAGSSSLRVDFSDCLSRPVRSAALLVPTPRMAGHVSHRGIPGLLVTVLLLRCRIAALADLEKARGGGRCSNPRDRGSRTGIWNAGYGIRIQSDNRFAPPGSRRIHRSGGRSRPPVAAFELISGLYRTRTLIVWTLWASAYFITNGLNNWMPTLYSSVYHLSLRRRCVPARSTTSRRSRF
jgi:putative MFS transporter